VDFQKQQEGVMRMPSINYDALDDLKMEYEKIRTRCTSLSSVYVSGEGDNPLAFIIGEAPGAQEEVQRRPFVGSSGIALRDLMATAQLYADSNYGHIPNCWLTNTVKFRPARNRKPLPIEVNAMRALLVREWQAIGMPQLIIPVGSTALTAIYGRNMSILKVSGHIQMHASRKGRELLYILPMIHPSFGLRNPGVRPLIERDWLWLNTWLQANKWMK